MLLFVYKFNDSCQYVSFVSFRYVGTVLHKFYSNVKTHIPQGGGGFGGGAVYSDISIYT